MCDVILKKSPITHVLSLLKMFFSRGKIITNNTLKSLKMAQNSSHTECLNMQLMTTSTLVLIIRNNVSHYPIGILAKPHDSNQI